MQGYKIKINSLPKRLWACETTVDNYEWQNRHSPDMLEISFSKFDTKNVIINNTLCVLKNSALACVVANETQKAFCEPGKPITIVTVAVRIQDFSFEPHRFTEADCVDRSTLLLPEYLVDLPLSEELALVKILHELIKLSSEQEIAFLSAFFKLLHKIDQMTRNRIVEKSENTNYYIKKINYIMETGFREKITLQSVAAQMNISPVYLSAMYKDSCGINFSEQLLNVRMKHAEKLLIDQNIPTAKVAELCGFCDENYFRKKFKLFFGMNVKEYRQIKNGLTLYHEKPQRKKPE